MSTLVQSTYHSPTCTGCPICSELAAAILANPTNPVLIQAMGNPTLRALAERELRKPVLRLAADSVPVPPDLYAAIRAGHAVAQPQPPRVASNGVPEPPDLYAAIRAAHKQDGDR
ncbi:MAG TPA: hypothetical protein VNJ02_00255 [Vicinamibacterales bacterium]|nr:hypothetical protein [Vicinamibacterales bacterium]